MPLSEDLLQAWSAPPGDTKAQAAYTQVKSALDSSCSLRSRTLDTYLQGSYRNATHIKEESDVDVIAELTSTFFFDEHYLSTSEKARFHAVYPQSGTYTYSEFKRDVGSALRSHFGDLAVTEGTKCFHVAPAPSRVAADILACLEHRTYITFPTYRDEESSYLPGIKFYDPKLGWVINWPKVHYVNGVTKNTSTSQRYKPLVRVSKNLRDLLFEAGAIAKGSAPSYYLESLIYNAPDRLFAPSLSATASSAFLYLDSIDISGLKCVNGLDPMFGGANTWSIDQASRYIDLAVHASR